MSVKPCSIEGCDRPFLARKLCKLHYYRAWIDGSLKQFDRSRNYEWHNHTGTKIYAIWRGMRERCFNADNKKYKYYGGRGITVCERWRDSFALFLKDMGEPSKGLTLDRIDNDGDYEPSNCRWATRKQQAINRRIRRFTLNGETLSVAEWSQRLGLKKPALSRRLRRWPLEKALSMPKWRNARCPS